MFFRLAASSLRYRRSSVLLSFFAIAIAVFVLLAVDQIRYQSKTSFSKTVSGIDLIVGPKTSDVSLLLASVFGLGKPEGQVSWQAYQKISSHPAVAWSIPIALGDSHKGYRIIGTTNDYFSRYTFAKRSNLSFAQGEGFRAAYDAVLGAKAAKQLGYSLGDELTLSHGMEALSFIEHGDAVFRVSGILEVSGSPVDQGIYVRLTDLEAVHRPQSSVEQSHNHLEPEGGHEAQTEKISLFYLGLKQRNQVFIVQALTNNFKGESIKAVLPGMALAELWKISGNIEGILQLVSSLVLLAALLGMSAMLLATMRERQHEINVLRMLGARPRYIFSLVQLEGLSITLLATTFAFTSLVAVMLLSQDYLARHYSLYLSMDLAWVAVLTKFGIILLCSALISCFPAFRAYKMAVN